MNQTNSTHNLFNLILVGLFSLLVIILALYHEPWRDEAQSWLLVSNTSLKELFHIMSYEVSPPLWHLILYPFAQSGLPYTTEFVIHLVLAIGGVTLFVCRSPFSWLTKLLFVFSYFTMFEYAIVARSYLVSVVFMLGIAALYKQRFHKPILYALVIVFLANTNSHSLVIAVSFCGFYCLEIFQNKKFNFRSLLPCLLMIAGIVFAVYILSPHGDNIHSGFLDNLDIPAPFVAIRNAFFPGYGFLYKGPLTALAIIALIITVASFVKNKKIFIPVMLSILGLLYVFTFKHNGSMRHHGFIFTLILVAKWVDFDGTDQQSVLAHIKNSFLKFSYKYSMTIINTILFISVTFSLLTYYREVNFLFSDSKNVARFLQEKNLIDKTIVAHDSPAASAILPYFPGKKFWYADVQKFGTYGIYNQEGSQWDVDISHEEVIKRARNHSKLTQDYLLLLTTPLSEKYKDEFLI